MEPPAQIAALEAARAQAAQACAKLFCEMAESGNAIITLRGLKSAPNLNGTLATIVANNVAPRKPAAGRMAVRLADESVIAVKFEHASPEIATGTRVAVNPELALSKDGGFAVEAGLGSVVECNGMKCHVIVDGAHGRQPPWATSTVAVEPWTKAGSLVLEASFCKQAELIATASTIDNDALAVQDAGTAEARQLGKARLRKAADAALRWYQLENHVGVRSLAALNQLAALRRLLHAQSMEAAGHSALVTLKEATALLGRTTLWERFPGAVMPHFYVECANVYLEKANLALGYPNLRSEADTHDSIMEVRTECMHARTRLAGCVVRSHRRITARPTRSSAPRCRVSVHANELTRTRGARTTGSQLCPSVCRVPQRRCAAVHGPQPYGDLPDELQVSHRLDRRARGHPCGQ